MKPLLGIFGGTFDPVHLGHLNAALQLQETLQFDRVHWVLSARPPHKNQVSASIKQRFKMLELALEPYSEFYADDTEIKRQAKSYTIDTIESLQNKFQDFQLCLIIGGDSMQKLSSWHRYQELIEQVNIVVMARPGYELTVPEFLQSKLIDSVDELVAAEQSKLLIFEDTNYDISSTKIRQLLAQQQFDLLPELLPMAVVNYIQTFKPYKMPNMSPEDIKNNVVDAVEDLKAQDVKVLEIGEISDFADYMVVVSGTSDTHVKAIAREASDKLRKLNVKPLNEDGAEVGEWVLVDFGDVVLHVMRPEVREYYDLEKLWDEDVREMLKQHRQEQQD